MTSIPLGDPAPARGGAYDYDGPVDLQYRPRLDRDADPGEIVWTWVSFEDDPSRGKDRPVAVIGGTPDGRLVVLMLSSKDHGGSPDWLPIGSGPWDRDGRPSWVRRNRVLAVEAQAVRREAAVLPRPIYDLLVSQLRSPQGARPPRDSMRTRLRRLLRRPVRP